MVRVDLTTEVDRAVEIAAATQGVKKRELIEEALRAYLKLPKGAAA